MKALVRQAERPKLYLSDHMRGRLSLRRGMYTIHVWSNRPTASTPDPQQIPRATLGKVYLSSMTHVWDLTYPTPLLFWADPSTSTIYFRPAKHGFDSDLDRLIKYTFDWYAQRYTAHGRLPPLHEFLRVQSIPISYEDGSLLTALVEAECLRLNLPNFTATPPTDQQLLEEPRTLGIPDVALSSDNPEFLQQVVARGRTQLLFRAQLLQLYNMTCVFCDSQLPNALEAAHILPWARCTGEADRINPANGLLLCATHHRLFDAGDLRVTPELKLEVTMDTSSLSAADQKSLAQIRQRTLVVCPAENRSKTVAYVKRRLTGT